MEYIVLKSTKIEGIVEIVNKYIKEGWKPQGGICESGTEGYLFFQAMTKES